MKKLNVVIENTDNDDVYPTTTPWWCNGKCLLIGCLYNKDLVCTKKQKNEYATCDFELPIPINCRFKEGRWVMGDEDTENNDTNIYGRHTQET